MHDDYWQQSIQPLPCLCFVTPLLVLYELGMAWWGPEAVRNGADVWLRAALAQLGFTEFCLLPMLSCGLLLAWHHMTRREWKLRGEVLSGMVCESFLLGGVLIVFAQLLALLWQDSVPTSSAMVLSQTQRIPHLLSYLGAGIYEELLFRLVLLSGLIQLCGTLGVAKRPAIGFSVLVSSLLFAAAHYRLFFGGGLDFSWFSFAFRVLAGVFFSLLFLRRGFGIVVGTHVVYDLLVAGGY